MAEVLHQLKTSDIKSFVLGGHSLVTLESGVTGARYTYKLKSTEDKRCTFVSMLTGPNNDDNYTYIGYFKNDLTFRTSSKSKVTIDSAPAKAIAYLLGHLNTSIPESLHVFHSCKCGCCGRTLTTPESIERGIGPECYKHIS